MDLAEKEPTFKLSGVDRIDRSACPISGEYSGILPDVPQFCGKMSSDCNNPDIMFYTVTDCTNTSEVLEGLHNVSGSE